MKMSYGPKHDPNVPVPERWRGYEFEYRHGWSWGGRRFVYNPISAVREDDTARRAWKSGQRDCDKALKKEKNK